MDLGAILRGRLGLWRTAAFAWLLTAAILVFQTHAWTGVHRFDTDDIMRLVQIRDWMAGQPWFDVDQHRGWPAPGFSMHWSRLGDLGVAGLVAVFGVGLPAAKAEMAALVAWPLIELFAMLVLIGVAARRLGGAGAMFPAMLLFGLSGPALWQFSPGRIDHHALQMIGAVAMTAAVLGLRKGALNGVAAGVSGAFQLAVGLEALPFWLALCGVAGLLLWRDGTRAAPAVGAMGLSVALATPAFAFAFNPTRYVASQVCDQTAWPVLALAVAGGLGLALAALVAGRSRSAGLRFLAVVLAGAAAVGAFMLVGPQCARGPFADVDPRLVPIWMDHVQEGKTLPWQLARLAPLAIGATCVLAFAVAAVAVLWRSRGRRDGAAILALLLLAAVATLFMQMRGVTYAMTLSALLLGAALPVVVRRLQTPSRHVGAAMLAGLLVLIGAPGLVRLVVAQVRPPAPDAVPAVADKGPGCLDMRAYARLAGLEPGLAAAPIDAGPFLLANTKLSVMSAPYHRNPTGIVANYELLTAPPALAEAKARAVGLDYVVLCRTGEVKLMQKAAPEGLVAALEAGRTPAWLTPVAGGAGQGARVWRVGPAEARSNSVEINPDSLRSPVSP